MYMLACVKKHAEYFINLLLRHPVTLSSPFSTFLSFSHQILWGGELNISYLSLWPLCKNDDDDYDDGG